MSDNLGSVANGPIAGGDAACGHAASATVLSAILAHIAERPAAPCLVFAADDTRVSYADLHHASLRLAGLLRAAGVGRGDIVLIFLPTHLDAYAAFLGAMLLSAVPSYMPGPAARQEPGQYWRDHAALLDRTAPRAILTDDATADAMQASSLLAGRDILLLRTSQPAAALPADAIARPAPDDVALLQHSSGTTGLKKGVMLSHRAVVRQIESYRVALDATGSDIVATWLPIYHDMGLISSTLMPLMLGQTIVVLDPFEWVLRPATLLQAVSRYRATLVWQPNFAFEHLVRTVDPMGSDGDLSHVRAFVNCSEPCRPASFERFAAHFAEAGVRPEQLQVCYAMAETVFAISQTQPGTVPRRLAVSAEALRDAGHARPPQDGEQPMLLLSNGRPIPGMRVRAVRPDGTACEEGAVGELVVQGDCLFDGYFRLPEQTRDRLLPDGLRTRDMGFIEGCEVFVLGRMDDLIIVHGRNYYAGEVEAAASRVPGIKPGRAVAFGVDNPRVGSQDIVVIAEPDGVPDAAEGLSRRVKAAVLQEMGLALHEVLIVQPGWLSKTTSGKISRERNRARYLADHGRSG